MLAPAAISTDLVLVGGGHSHALALRMLAMRPVQGLRISLVSPASHTPYSGMLPGLIAGHYHFEDAHIDLARLCEWAGVRFIAGEVTGLDPVAQRLSLAGRSDIEYDLVSLDIGSQPELRSVPGAAQHAVPVKPVAGLWQRWQQLLQRLDALSAGGAQQRIAVVGGGAGSVELALAMAHSLAQHPVEITLWCGAPAILQGYNAGARKSAMQALSRHGVALAVNARVAQVENNALLLADGHRAPFDELFWCTGAAAADWIAGSGLPVDDRGFLLVADTLHSVADERVFGAGDIATQRDHPRPKAGVYAVRQAPVLAHNLRAAALGKPLRQHRPQQRFLSLVSLGDRQATADRGPFSATGKWVWRWKDRIDRAFMARFEQLPASMPRGNWGSVGDHDGAPAQAPCGGCGAKVGADPLTAVLAELAHEFPHHCPAPEMADDSAPIPGSGPVVQSIDMLRQLVADPWLMGRIAANHALSDLYACGARPVSALAAVTLPFAGPRIQQRELKQLLAGALHEFERADCLLAGGHSMQGPELNIGFVVNGRAMASDGRLLGKSSLAVGDRLILAKPLGTGVLFAAHMQRLADGRDITAAIEIMLVSNGPAAELALAHKATAGTDVTGFGLLGHLLEMLAGDQGARLQLARLPLLDGALAQLRRGVRSSMHPANAAAGGALVDRAAADQDLLQILFDPQTSGGLLLGVPAAGAARLRDALREAGYPQAEIIGEVVEADPARSVTLA